MLDYPWTAAEVWELVKDWPAEAKPKGVVVSWPKGMNSPEYAHLHHWSYLADSGGLTHVPDHLAAALHAHAGLVWLMDHCPVAVMLSRWNDGSVGVQFLANGDWHVGPTDLHAVSAAVRAVAG